MSDPEGSPLDPAVFADESDVTGALYEELLARLPALLDDVGASKSLWEEEDAYLSESETAIASGTVAIDERPDIDLAVLHIPEEWEPRGAHRFTVSWTGALHPMAVNGATTCFRVLMLYGRRARLECRYETWVQMVSRPVLPRPDLRDLAAVLDELEGASRWRADPPAALTPVLAPRDSAQSTLAPERLIAAITEWLSAAPGAWDPWASRT